MEDYLLNPLRELVPTFAKPGVDLVSIDLRGAALNGFCLRVALQEVQLVLKPLGGRREVFSRGRGLKGGYECRERNDAPDEDNSTHYRASASLAGSEATTGLFTVPVAMNPLPLARKNFRFHSRLNEISPLTSRTPEVEVIFEFCNAMRCLSIVKRPVHELNASGELCSPSECTARSSPLRHAKRPVPVVEEASWLALRPLMAKR